MPSASLLIAALLGGSKLLRAWQKEDPFSSVCLAEDVRFVADSTGKLEVDIDQKVIRDRQPVHSKNILRQRRQR